MTSAAAVIRAAAWAKAVNGLKSKPTVVYIGGLFARPYQPLALKAAVTSRCNFNFIEYDYNARSKTLEEHAIELADFLLTLKQHALHTLPEHMRQAGVHFVTHSCGALVLRSALHRIAYDDMGCRVVMLAPTNRGCSLLRRLGSGDANILLKTVTRTIVGDMFGRHLTRLSPEQAARTIPPLPAKYPALVVVGTENLSYGTPFLPGNEKCDGVVLESETRLDTPAVYAHVHATHTLMLYHPTTLLVTSSFLKEPSSFFL